MYFNVFKTILGLQLHGHSCFSLMTTILQTHYPLSNRLEVEWLIQEARRNKPNDYNIITLNINIAILFVVYKRRIPFIVTVTDL